MSQNDVRSGPRFFAISILKGLSSTATVMERRAAYHQAQVLSVPLLDIIVWYGVKGLSPQLDVCAPILRDIIKRK